MDKHRLAITSAVVLGVAAGSYGIASAASGNGTTTTTPSTTQSTPTAPTAPSGRPWGHQRSDETVLTGDTAAKVTDIAKSKVPGGTIIRVEADADGNAAYEAHMINADGTPVTVYVDKDLNFVSIETGGPGGHGGPGHQRSDETALTGDTAAKVTAAAKAKVPGGTVLRVESDGDGNAAYEAHMINADGTPVTVYVDKDFNVVSVETGGPGGHGFGGPDAPPQQSNGTA